MKPHCLILLTFLSITIFIGSCKKSADMQAAITGKWRFDSIQTRYVNGQLNYQTIYRSAIDYYDFRADGRLYYLYNSYMDTLPYELVTIDRNVYIKYGGILTDTIKVLTNNFLLLMNPQGNGSKFFFSK